MIPGTAFYHSITLFSHYSRSSGGGREEGVLPKPGRHRVLRQRFGHKRHQAGVLLLHRGGVGGPLRDLPLSRLTLRWALMPSLA